MANLKYYNNQTSKWEEIKVSTRFKELLNTKKLTADQNYVNIDITSYNPNEDVLFVILNSTWIQKDEDYVINGGLLRIESKDGSNWKNGDTFNFVVLKNVDKDAVPTADGSLIQDGSITISKLATSIQNYITKIGTAELTTIADDLSGAVNELNTHLSDMAIDLRVFGAKANDSNFDNTQAFQNAINSVSLNGNTKILIPAGIYYYASEITIPKSSYKISVEGSYNTIFVYKGNQTNFINGIGINSNVYSDRLTDIFFKNIAITQTQALSSSCINLENFGFINLENVKISEFNKGINLKNGSELVGKNLFVAGNNYGISFNQDISVLSTTTTDMANINLENCNIVGNYIKSIDITNCRQISFKGGVIGASSNDTSLAIDVKSSNGVVEQVNFIGVTIDDGRDINIQPIQIGDGTGVVKQINFENCTFYNKYPIINVKTCDVLNIVNCVSQVDTYPLVILDANAIGMLDINIKNVNRKRTVYVDNRIVFNSYFNLFSTSMDEINYNVKLDKGLNGYYVPHPANITSDSTNFVTGINSYVFGTLDSANDIRFNITSMNIESAAKGYIAIDAIIKSTNVNIVKSLIHVIFKNSDGSYTDELLDYNDKENYRSYIVQKWANGFVRIVGFVKIPSDKGLAQVIISNANDITNSFAVDYLAVYVEKTNTHLDNKKIYLATAPTTGTWSAGEKVTSPTLIAGGYENQICITSGTPGVWKGAGLIQS